jgi:hypothetical protein
METFSIDRPVNREVLAYLMGIAAVYNLAAHRDPPDQPRFMTEDEVGLDDLRTHPDLGGLLYGLAQQMPGVTHGYVLGFDVLVNSQGVIFAVATGMMYMAFRVNPPDPKTPPPDEKATRMESLSCEWQNCAPFGEPGDHSGLTRIAGQALENVNRLSG